MGISATILAERYDSLAGTALRWGGRAGPGLTGAGDAARPAAGSADRFAGIPAHRSRE